MGRIEDLIRLKQSQQSDTIHETVVPIIYNTRTREAAERQAEEGTKRLRKLREQAVIRPDYRTSDQRAADDKETDYKHQQYQKQKDAQKRAEGLENLIKLTSPSTYVEAVTGEQLTPAGKLAADVAIFSAVGGTKNLITKSNIGQAKFFSTSPVTRATPIHTAKGNPLQTRLARLKEHTQYGFTPETNQGLMITPRLRGNNVREFAKQIDPTLTEDQLDQVVQIAYANRRGVHIPIGNNAGETTGGLSIVDIQDAVNYLKQSGIKYVTPYDVGIIAGHEAGHGVQISPAARKAIQDFSEPEEFYTRAGQILDSAGITSTADSPLSYGQFMQLTNDYLKQGNLDNGITVLKNYMSNLSPLKRQKVMAGINRFSVGLGTTYLLRNKQ